MALILDGIPQDKTLKIIHKNKSWLKNELDQKGLTPEDIFYAFYKNKKIYIIKKSEVL